MNSDRFFITAGESTIVILEPRTAKLFPIQASSFSASDLNITASNSIVRIDDYAGNYPLFLYTGTIQTNLY